jgi:uncharacterized protein (DUF58 family)
VSLPANPQVEADVLLGPAEIAEVELFILKRMKESATGSHISRVRGSGSNLAALREWQPGDPIASVDWAASSLSSFSPLIAREFEQDSNATVLAIADASASTRCGARGLRIATAIARCLATVGLCAAFFQDAFGLMAMDARLDPIVLARPRVGKAHVTHCLGMYQRCRMNAASELKRTGALSASIEAHLRRTSLVYVISDFLFVDADRVLRELAGVNTRHDVLLLMLDTRFAFEFPDVSAGWVEGYDVETGGSRIFSRREFARLAARVEQWLEQLLRQAQREGLDMVRMGPECWEMEDTLLKLVAERRLRKVEMT